MKSILMGALVGSLFLVTACQNKHEAHEFVVKEVPKPILEPEIDYDKPAAPAAAASDESELDRGKRIWTTTCIQCHNKDPNVKGAIGPETVDAPLDVMMSKVMTGKYPEPLPPGFVPKRKTRAMRPLPQFEKDVPAIWAYVQSVKKNK